MKKMTKNRFKELCTNGAHLYIARVYNEEESFYKIGITSKESAYNRLLNLPYNFRILQEVFHPDPGLIFNLEKHLISRGTRYTPKIEFAGQSECVVEVDAILEYLNSLTWIDGMEFKELEKVERPESPYIVVSHNYIEALLKLEDSFDTEELEETIKSVEENPRYKTLVEYIGIFGVDEYLLEGNTKKLAEYYLRKKINAYRDKQKLREFLSSKYKVGDTIIHEDLRQVLVSAYESLSLSGKLKLTDINLAFETKPTSILIAGKKENAVKLVDEVT